MSQVFANTIDGNPIYAARAVADEDGLNLKQYYAKIADLAAVAFSGSWNDLANTPTIPTKTSDLTNDSGFITASDIPAIPTKTSDLTNDSGFITASDIPAQVNADWNENDPTDPAYIENKPTIPVVPTTDQTYDASSSNPQSGVAVAQALSSFGLSFVVYNQTSYADARTLAGAGKTVFCVVPVGTSGTRLAFLAYIASDYIEFQYYRSVSNGADEVYVYTVNASGWTTSTRSVQVQADWNQTSSAAASFIKNKPDMSLYALISSLSTVATSGSYLDLTDLPTISNVPAVTSSDNGKVLKASYSGGTGSYSWETAPSGLPASTSADEGKVLKVDANGDPEWDTAPASQVQADWTESDNTDPSYIQNKPTEQALVAGQGITITEANNQVTIGCNVQAPVQDVTLDGNSVLNNGVAALTSEVEILEYGSTGAWAKLTAAITAGKSILCKVDRGSNNYRMVPLSFYNTVSGTAEFNFHLFTSSKGYNTQSDELYAYTLASDGTWTTNTNNVAMKYMNGDGLDRTVVTGGTGSITFFVKPKTGGGIGVDSNGVYAENPLPASAAADEGKVLVVNSSGNAEWDDLPEELYIFTEGTAATDAANIAAAITAGKKVVLRVQDGNYYYDLPLVFWRASETFKFTALADSQREFIKTLDYSNNTWTWSSIVKKTIIPNYGSGDAGKVLVVNSGGTATTWEALATTAEIQAIVV